MALPVEQRRSRLFVHLLDDGARETPDRMIASIPKGDDPSAGFVDLSYRQMANAVNYACTHFKDHMGLRPRYEFETLMYIGIPDIRYFIFTFACIKSGFKIFLVSPRNTAQTNAYLAEQTRCTRILYSSERLELVKKICSAGQSLDMLEVPSLSKILAGKVAHVSYDFTYEEARSHRVMVLHSSGSTGKPKSIVYTNASIATYGADKYLTPQNGRKFSVGQFFDADERGGRLYGTFPPFHVGGVYLKIFLPIYSLAIAVWEPATRTPSAELVFSIMQNQKIRGLAVTPSILEELMNRPQSVQYLKGLDFILSMGGALSKPVGDRISQITTLCNFYGSTETLSIRSFVPQNGEWQWMEFHPEENIRMEPADDNTYELVLVADPKTSDRYAGSTAFQHSLPGTTEFHTKDLFINHPKNPDMWQYYGRRDDILVLSSGLNINPLPMEGALTSDSAILGALVVGAGQIRTALIVEPQPEFRDNSDFMDRVWKLVEKANSAAYGPARVSRDMILISSPEKPFARAVKGTMIRKVTIDLYKDEIKGLYDRVREETFSGTKGKRQVDFDTVTLEEIRDLVAHAINHVLPESSLDDSSDFYLSGMDSLMTADAINRLADKLGSNAWLIPNLFYTHSTISQLASAIFSNIKGTNGNHEQKLSVSATIDHFRASLRQIISSPPSNADKIPLQQNRTKGLRIAVTGTTGRMGTQIIDALLNEPDVSEILCLNRSKTAGRDWQRSEDATSANMKAIDFVTVDFPSRGLGLSLTHLDKVHNCDIFIHNAWKVNFNQALSSFQDNLESICSIVELCAKAKRPPHLVFVSSVASAEMLKHVPEASLDDLSHSAFSGYGESKLVSEHILEEASMLAPSLRVTILRVGQVAGPSTVRKGSWAEREAFPSLFKTSKAIGLIPNNLPPINWIPIDLLAKVILELSMAGAKDGETVSYRNVVNPATTRWEDLIQPLQEYCGQDAKTVSLGEWVGALRAFDRTDAAELRDKPALKILEFFEHMCESKDNLSEIDTSKAAADSQSLASLKAIDQHLMRMWLSSM